MFCNKCNIDITIDNMEEHVHSNHPDIIYTEFLIEEINLTHAALMKLIKSKDYDAARLVLCDYDSYVSMLCDCSLK